MQEDVNCITYEIFLPKKLNLKLTNVRYLTINLHKIRESQKYIKIYHKEETVSQNQNLENHTQLYIMLPRKKNGIIKGIKEAVNLKKNIKQI